MKFTKFIAASFAALAMFSCSKEVLDVENGPGLKPGDTRIVFNLSKGATTYGTSTQENAITGLAYAIYDKSGNKITTIDNVPNGKERVDLTIEAEAYAKLGTDLTVTLCIIANSHLTTATMPNTLGDKISPAVGSLRAEAVNINPNADIATNGLVASREVQVDLSAAVNNVVTVSTSAAASKLTRGVARFWVTIAGKKADGSSFTRADVEDAVVAIANVSEGVTPFSDPANTAFVGTVANYTYNMKGAVLPDDQYTPSSPVSASPQEAAFYTYPTASGAKITVTLKSGDSMPADVNQSIEANKNYSITIFPKIVNGTTVIDHLEIDEWTLTSGGNFDVDFSDIITLEDLNTSFNFGQDITTSVDGIGFENNVTLPFEHNMEVIYTKFPKNVMLTGIVGDITTYAPGLPQTAVSPDGLFKIDVTNGKLKVIRNFNYGQDAKYTVSLKADDSKTYIVKLWIEGAKYPENLSTKFNGIEVMNFGPNRSGLKTFETIITDISSGGYLGSNFQDQLADYIKKADAAKMSEIDGIVATNTQLSNYCPAGYRLPTQQEVQTLIFSGPAFVPTAMATGNNQFPTTVPKTFGTNTITYTGTYTNDYGDGYYVIENNDGNKIVFGNRTSLHSSTGASPYRISIWANTSHATIFAANVAAGASGSNTRCVKITTNF